MKHLPQITGGYVLSDPHPRLELHPLRHKLAKAAIKNVFLQLEVGNPVPKQTTDTIVLLENGDLVARASQLLRSRKPRRSRTHNRHPMTGPPQRKQRLNPVLRKGPFGNLVLDVFDQHRLVLDVQRARSLARRGADPTGNLRKVVRRVKILGRFTPSPPIDQIIELGNPVHHRTPRAVAKRNAAIHTPRGLTHQHLHRVRQIGLPIVTNPLPNRPMHDLLATMLHEPRRLSHGTPPPWPA